MVRAELTVSRDLVERLYAIPFTSLPTDVLDHARALILDTRMVALAGARQPDVDVLTTVTRSHAGTPDSPIWACGFRVPATEAAFINALAASALDYDSLHDKVHPDAIALASAWAVASAAHSSGPAFLRAFVLGSELICRLSDASVGPQKGWSINAVVGTFGSAAAAALLFELTPEQATHAFGLCLSMAAGSQQANVEQVLAKRLQPALAARAGVHAAILARAGMTAPAEVFEGRFGLWNLYFPASRDRLLEGFGSRYSMLATGLKKYPVCACSHAAMEALRELMIANDVQPHDVQRVKVVVSPFMARLVGGEFHPHANPQVTAQFSLQYALASIALRGRLGVQELAPTAVCDPAIASFVQRVSIVVNESSSGELAPALVRLELRSGRLAECQVHHMPGSQNAPMTAEQRREKHLECAGVWDPTRTAEIVDEMTAESQELAGTQDVSLHQVFRKTAIVPSR